MVVPKAQFDPVLIREHLYQDTKKINYILPPPAKNPGFRSINEIGIGYNNYHLVNTKSLGVMPYSMLSSQAPNSELREASIDPHHMEYNMEYNQFANPKIPIIKAFDRCKESMEILGILGIIILITLVYYIVKIPLRKLQRNSNKNHRYTYYDIEDQFTIDTDQKLSSPFQYESCRFDSQSSLTSSSSESPMTPSNNSHANLVNLNAYNKGSLNSDTKSVNPYDSVKILDDFQYHDNLIQQDSQLLSNLKIV